MRTVMPPWHVEAVQLYDLDVANRIVGVRGECELGAAFAADSKYVFRLSHGGDCVVLGACAVGGRCGLDVAIGAGRCSRPKSSSIPEYGVTNSLASLQRTRKNLEAKSSQDGVASASASANQGPIDRSKDPLAGRGPTTSSLNVS